MLRAISSIGVSGGGIGLKSSGVLAQSAVAASVTGTLTETTLGQASWAAGAVADNGRVRVRALWDATNVTLGTWQPQLRVNGTLLQNFGPIANTNKGLVHEWDCWRVGNQIQRYNTQNPNGISTAAPVTSSVDISGASTIALTGTLSNTGDTLKLLAVTFELLNP